MSFGRAVHANQVAVVVIAEIGTDLGADYFDQKDAERVQQQAVVRLER